MQNLTFTTQKDREDAKNKAVEIRESGDILLALEIFQAIEKWDEAHANIKGLLDVLGHIRITYTLLANQTNDQQIKKDLLKKVSETVQKIKQLLNTHVELPEGVRAIQLIHIASANFELLSDKIWTTQLHETKFQTIKEESKGASKKESNNQPEIKPNTPISNDTLQLQQQLQEILQDVEQAIAILPGSKAHKAWPMNLKAQIQYALGNLNGALTTIADAQQLLFEGYEAEVAGGDQAEIKLNVWLSGLMLTMATICQKENRLILARHYANYVVTMDYPYLENRRNQAEQILKVLGQPIH